MEWSDAWPAKALTSEVRVDFLRASYFRDLRCARHDESASNRFHRRNTRDSLSFVWRPHRMWEMCGRESSLELMSSSGLLVVTDGKYLPRLLRKVSPAIYRQGPRDRRAWRDKCKEKTKT